MKKAQKHEAPIKNTTISDVAGLAGVTIGTVSHVINGTATISEETTAKVEHAIKKLGYKPNLFARNLRRNQSKMIGLLVPDLIEFYSSIARNFIDHAYDNGYSVMLSSFQYSIEREKREFDVFVKNMVDAIVLFGGMKDEELLTSVMKSGMPIILCDRRVEFNSFSTIEFDNEATMRKVVRMLKEKGYTSLGYVSEPLELTNVTDRYSGFKIGAFEQGLEVLPENVFFSDSLKLDKLKNSYIFMKKLLEQRPAESLPKVFVTTSDMIAVGMIEAMNESGYRVPEDFGVVGFDNISISAHISPALTTVKQDGWMMAKSAWEAVSDTLTKKVEKPICMKLNSEIIVRESC